MIFQCLTNQFSNIKKTKLKVHLKGSRPTRGFKLKVTKKGLRGNCLVGGLNRITELNNKHLITLHTCHRNIIKYSRRYESSSLSSSLLTAEFQGGFSP